MKKAKLTRRQFVATSAAASAMVAAPFVRTAHAAGKLSIMFWDHWVPGGNNASKALCEEWGAKNKVELQIDYMTSQGHKNLLTIAAESQAKSGHDILAFPTWQPADHANNLEPVDDVMAELIKTHGKVNPTVEYLARANNKWLAVPTCVGSQIKGPCSRIDLLKKHADIDILAMYPAGGAPKADGWTLDAMLKAAEACHKGGNPFGIGLGTPEDNVDTAGAIFQSFGAALVDAKGKITVKSDPVRKALEYYIKLAQWLPPDAPAWDNASNNKYLVVRQGLADHEPAERLGGGQARCAASGRAVLDPRHARRVRPAGMRRSCRTSGASGTSARTRRRPRTCCCSCRSARRSRRWWMPAPATTCRRSRSSPTSRSGPRSARRKGTLYHYPNPYNHQILSVAAAPAPPKIAVQIYTQAIHTKMIVRILKGEKMEQTLAWAEGELEGYMRT